MDCWPFFQLPHSTWSKSDCKGRRWRSLLRSEWRRAAEAVGEGVGKNGKKIVISAAIALRPRRFLLYLLLPRFDICNFSYSLGRRQDSPPAASPAASKGKMLPVQQRVDGSPLSQLRRDNVGGAVRVVQSTRTIQRHSGWIFARINAPLSINLYFYCILGCIG